MRGRNFSNIGSNQKGLERDKGHIYFKMCGTGLKAVGLSNVEIISKKFISGEIIKMRIDDHLRD